MDLREVEGGKATHSLSSGVCVGIGHHGKIQRAHVSTHGSEDSCLVRCKVVLATAPDPVGHV